MLLHVTMIESHIGPGCVGHTVPVLQHIVLRKNVSLVHILDILLGVQHLGDAGQTLVGKHEVVGNLTLSRLTFLSGDKNNSVTSFGSVDSGRGCILQDFHRGDGAGVDTTDITQAHTINNEQGL